MQWILGRPNFWCGPIAHQLVKLGHKIERKAEAEQAYVLHWLLGLHELHGERFRVEANKILDSTADTPKPKGAAVDGEGQHG